MTLPLLPVIAPGAGAGSSDFFDSNAAQFNFDELAVQFPLPYLARGVKTILDYDPKVGDGVTPADTALADYLTDNPNAGLLLLPPGVYLFNSPWPSLEGKIGYSVLGFGGRTAGTAATTRIVYAGSAAPFIPALSTYGYRIADCQIQYTNASFAGTLIDYGHGSVITHDSAYASLERCTITGTLSTATGATELVSLANAHSDAIRSCLFNYAVCAVRGRKVVGDYSNRIVLDDCEFGQTSQAPIQSAGQAWTVNACTFEGLSSGNAGAYSQAVGSSSGVTFTGCWFGDSNSSGTWIDFTGAGNGLVVRGNYISTGAVGVNLAASSFGCVVEGNAFVGTTTAIQEGANCRRNRLQPNFFSGVTTELTNASSLEEQLWTLRGGIAAAGTIGSGLGFTVSHPSAGVYTISFTIAFGGPPAVTVSLGNTLTEPLYHKITAVSSSAFTINTSSGAGPTLGNTDFYFNATGPR